MRVWRLLVEVGSAVRTYVVAAPDHVTAWQTVLQALTVDERRRASLEELEGTGERRATGRPRIVHTWQSAPRALRLQGSPPKAG